MSRTLIVVGLIIVAVGLLWPWLWPALRAFPLGRLPGDLIIRRDGFTVYIPLATMLLVSGVVSLLLWLFGR